MTTARVLTFARDDMTARAALDGFLSGHKTGTARIYRGVLERVLSDAAGVARGGLHTVSLSSISTEALSTAFHVMFAGAAPRTRNARIAAVRSFISYARKHGWPVGDLELVADRDAVPQDDTKALHASQVAALFADEDIPLRERLLWTMLKESGARAQEILNTNVEDLDQPLNRVMVTRKGGRREWVVYQTGTARLLPRYLQGRTRGPIFLADRAPVPARKPALADLCPVTGRGRLSYRRAETLFKRKSGGRTLHVWRHTKATELAEAGYSLPEIAAITGHSWPSLRHYVRLGHATAARIAAATDPARRG